MSFKIFKGQLKYEDRDITDCNVYRISISLTWPRETQLHSFVLFLQKVRRNLHHEKGNGQKMAKKLAPKNNLDKHCAYLEYKNTQKMNVKF